MFDTFLMVDWSAANRPRIGRDSIWVCRRRREEERLFNPSTRREAKTLLRELLEEAFRGGERVLAGFDFPFGYPSGLAALLALEGPPWRALWQKIASLLHEGALNQNNRFEVAAALNKALAGQAFPFWGCPAGKEGPCLKPKSHRAYRRLGVGERRLIDDYLPSAQPCWKLLGAGSVGGQALTGIPLVKALREDPLWAESAAVWPFETGLAAPGPEARVVFAEIYPSLWPLAPDAGEIKDRAQVSAAARHFGECDKAGELAPLFSGDPGLSPQQRRPVESEEGWILGVTRRQSRAARVAIPASSSNYLRDPAEITRRSFAAIRAETDLERFPPAIRGLALRLAHAAGDAGILADLAWSEGAAERGRSALLAGAPILVDSEMVAAGIARTKLPAANPVICTLNRPETHNEAERLGTTRSAAAVDLWREHLLGSIVAIGTAPTALFRLLEVIAEGAGKPALVLGFAVGFIGAAEGKAALIDPRRGLSFIALKGRRGGSAFAAAALNALLERAS